MPDVTTILNAIDRGEADADQLLAVVYDELRRLAAGQMRRERPGQTLQATALVHEAFLRMTAGSGGSWQNRRHFFGAAVEAMRRILVEQARRKARAKHGGGIDRIDLPDVAMAAGGTPREDILALNEALAAFEELDPEKAELVKLRYFGGLSESGAAQTLGISRATASRWWNYAKAWLYARIQRE